MPKEHSRPIVLTIPGLWNSGPDHWQTAWERERPDCHRVELGCWDDPIRNVWISRIDQAVHDARGDVVISGISMPRPAWATGHRDSSCCRSWRATPGAIARAPCWRNVWRR